MLNNHISLAKSKFNLHQIIGFCESNLSLFLYLLFGLAIPGSNSKQVRSFCCWCFLNYVLRSLSKLSFHLSRLWSLCANIRILNLPFQYLLNTKIYPWSRRFTLEFKFCGCKSDYGWILLICLIMSLCFFFFIYLSWL